MHSKLASGYSSTYIRLLQRLIPGCLALAVVVTSLAANANGQLYKSIDPKLNVRAARQLRGKVNGALRTAPFAADGQQAMDDYFKKFYFPRMTQYDPQSLTLLGKLREDMMKLMRGARVPKAQEHLAKLALNITRVLARDNYHPAVRYNATLILGQLDKQFPVTGANPVAPIVLVEGTEALLELLEKPEFNGLTVHPSVKVGALEGLDRHVQFGMDAKFAERVRTAALGVINQDAKALEIDSEVDSWMKCQAARILARQSKTGPSKAVHDALTALIADDQMTIEDRCCVSGSLKMMTYAAGAEADAATTVLPLGNLTKSVVDEGAEVARDFQAIILGERRVARPASRGRGQGDTGPKLERRELLSRLVQIDAGAKSLAEGMADAEKQKLASLTSIIEPVIQQSRDTKKFDDIDLIRSVFKLEESVDSLVASWQPAAPPAGDAVDFDE